MNTVKMEINTVKNKNQTHDKTKKQTPGTYRGQKNSETQRELSLFLTFLKIGAFTFGGGYAMIALLENEFINRKHWIEREEFLDMIAIAESTPGPAAVNSATYLGYKVAGVLGAFLSTLAVCTPSFCIIYLISLFFDQFLALSIVSSAFRGIQVCVIYLILTAGLRMMQGLKKTPFDMVILLTVTVLMIAFSIFSVSFSSIFFILICGIAGVAVYLIRSIQSKGRNLT